MNEWLQDQAAKITVPVTREDFVIPAKLVGGAFADLVRWPAGAADWEMERQFAFGAPHPWSGRRMRYNYGDIIGSGAIGFLGATIKLPLQIGWAITQEIATIVKGAGQSIISGQRRGRN